MTSWFPELASIAQQFLTDAIIDGEIISADGSISSLDSLMARSRRRRLDVALPISFVAFDLLVAEQRSVVNETLEDRFDQLTRIVSTSEILSISQRYDSGAELFVLAVKHWLEGVVGKKRGSQYISGRSRKRIKVKIPGASAGHKLAQMSCGL